MLGVDCGRPDVPDDVPGPAGERRAGAARPRRTVVKSPGVPERGAGHRRGARARAAGARRAGAGLAAAAEPLRRGDRDQRQDDDRRAAGRDLPSGAACRSPWRGTSGTPLSSLVGDVAPDATVICEVSSFQLEDSVAFAPDIGLLLNLDADHLDRHGSFEAYREAKLRMFARQTPRPGRDRAATGSSCRRAAPRAARGRRRCSPGRVRLRGPHNLENAGAAAAVALAAGVPDDAVARGAAHVRRRAAPARGGRDRGRRALRQRLEGDQRGVRRASRIESFDAGVHVILGGSLKGGGFSGCASRRGALRAPCYLIGEAADRLAADLRDAGVPLHRCGDLDERRRGRLARPREPGEVVLLSPACASYDQFARLRGARASAFERSFRVHESRAARRRHARMAARAARKRPPVEYSILYTATLCLLAFGAVMVYSASSAESLLSGPGDPSYYLKRYLMCGAIGLVAMHLALAARAERRSRPSRRSLLIGSFGADARGDAARRRRDRERRTRWLGAGPAAVPALGAVEGLAGPLRGAARWRRDRARRRRFKAAVQPAADRGCGGLPAAAQAARHGHGAGDLPRDRHAADRGGHAGAAAWARSSGSLLVLALHLRAARALPARAADLVPGPVRGRQRRRLPGGAGAHGDRARAASSASAWASRCRRSSTCPRRTPT